MSFPFRDDPVGAPRDGPPPSREYLELPESIRAQYPWEAYRWLSDLQKAQLVTQCTEPEWSE